MRKNYNFPSQRNGWRPRHKRDYGAWWFIIGLVAFLGAITYFNYEVLMPILDTPTAHACTTLEECCKFANDFTNGNEICL